MDDASVYPSAGADARMPPSSSTANVPDAQSAPVRRSAGHGAESQRFGSWNHDFLNKKPWHPMSFRNRVRVWEAEQAANEKARLQEQARQQFEAEQNNLRNAALLTPAERTRYEQLQSVGWLYAKPPGFQGSASAATQHLHDQGDGAVDAPAQHLETTGGGKAGDGEGASHRKQRGGNHIARVVGGVKAVVAQQQERFELKRELSGGRSPPRGGIDPGAANQQFVMNSFIDSDEEEAAYRFALMSEEERTRVRREAWREAKRERRRAEKERIEEAKAFLRAAGISISEGDVEEEEETSSASLDGDDDAAKDGSKSANNDAHEGIKRRKRAESRSPTPERQRYKRKKGRRR